VAAWSGQSALVLALPYAARAPAAPASGALPSGVDDWAEVQPSPVVDWAVPLQGLSPKATASWERQAAQYREFGSPEQSRYQRPRAKTLLPRLSSTTAIFAAEMT